MNLRKIIAASITILFIGTAVAHFHGCTQPAEKNSQATRKVEQPTSETVKHKPVASTSDYVGVAESKPLTVEIFAQGIPHRIPSAVVMQFSKSMIDKKKVGQKAGPKTTIKIEPDIRGALYWEDASRLIFRPEEAIPFGTEFEFELLRVEAKDGIMRSPRPAGWKVWFKTPSFNLRSAVLEKSDLKKNEAEIVLFFTGPVSSESVRAKTKIKLGNELERNFKVYSRPRPEEILIKLAHHKPKKSETLKLNIVRGVKALGVNAKTKVDSRFEFSPGKSNRLKISSFYRQEGASGFYFVATCNDYTEERYWSKCEIPVENLHRMVTVVPDAGIRFIPKRHGFRIFGDFEKGKYTVIIEAGLTSENGGVLAETMVRHIEIPQRSSRAIFSSKGRYIPRGKLAAVPVKHINVSDIAVSVRKIPEQNIVYWLSGYNEKANDRVSDIIGKKEFKVEKYEDVEVTSWLDLSDMVPADQRGIFEFSLKTRHKRDALRLILTDLSLVAKRYGEKGENVMVWVLDSQTLSPRSGAEVELMSKSNRVMARATADSDGMVVFNDVIDELSKGKVKPFAVIVRSGDDLTALKFGDLELGLSEYKVQGAPYKSNKVYDAAIYMDRGVYRPGETAHLVSIVREKSTRAPDKAVPVVGKLVDPKGKTIEKISGRTNDSGMVPFDFKFEDYAPTGKYNFHLDIGGKRIAQHSFLVEEFVPERMKVEVKPESKAGVLASQSAKFEVNARYLFGSPARGERVEATCTLDEGVFEPEKHAGYYFGVWSPLDFQPIPLGKYEAILDDTGRGEILCAPANDVTILKGPGKIRVTANVFEAGSGRTTVASAVVPLHPEKNYIGLKGSAKKAENGRDFNVNGIVVDLDGKIVNEISTVTVELLEVQADWVWEYDADLDRNTWRNYMHETFLSKKTVEVKNGKFQYSFVPSGYTAGYIVRATSGRQMQTDLYVRSKGFYWWDYSNGTDRTPRPTLPEGLVLNVPDSLQIGKPAKIEIKLPYPGKLLFSLETDRVIQSKWYDVAGPTFTTSITLDEFAPNVYVSALLVKKPFHESDGAFVPGRAFGIKSIKIVPERHEIALGMETPLEVQPNSELIIKLDVGAVQGPVFATVAAVDEGILQLTRYRTPDPLADIFRKRALGVKTFETIGWTLLLPRMFDENSPGGGDDEMAAENGARDGYESRVHSIKPVALWSGPVEVGMDGKAVVKFDVPVYRGELRVVAVAVSADRIGVAESSVKVRDPIVLQPTFPRFLIAGDVFVLPIFLTNMTGSDENVEVELAADKVVEIVGAAKKSVELESGEAGTVTFLCKAVGQTGAAVFKVEARGSKTVSRDSATIPLIPNSPVLRESEIMKLHTGENDLTAMLKGWSPQYERTTISVLPHRYARELGHLKYLVRYPYGCIEQTTSTVRPLLYMGNLIPSLDPDILKDGTVEEKFMRGVGKIFSMQTSDGGFSYWPGQSTSTFWGSAYATHLLLEGIEAGYPINEFRVKDAVNFIERTLNSNPDGIDRRYGYSVANAEPYMHYVLAKAGKAHKARIRKLLVSKKDDWAELSEENKYLLMAALYLAGDRTYEKKLKKVPLEIPDSRTNGWSYWSALRTRGMMLNIMEDLFPGSAEAEPLAGAIAERLRGASGYYTTQELSWCVSALGKRAAGGAKDWSEPLLTIDGKKATPLPAKYDYVKERTWTASGASGGKKLRLTVDSIEGGNLYALVQVEGIKPGVPYKTGDNSLKVRRKYRSQSGSTISPTDIKLGDVVYVELTLENLTEQLIRNVALVDRFGAGFDIENPRLNRDHAASWIDTGSMWNSSYVNMRDDRIEIFGHLEPKRKVTAVYVMRAVVGGKFTTPPVRAEAMYDPRFFSQRLGKNVTILDPWRTLTD